MIELAVALKLVAGILTVLWALVSAFAGFVYHSQTQAFSELKGLIHGLASAQAQAQEKAADERTHIYSQLASLQARVSVLEADKHSLHAVPNAVHS